MDVVVGVEIYSNLLFVRNPYIFFLCHLLQHLLMNNVEDRKELGFSTDG